MGLYPTKNLLHSKGNHEQNEGNLPNGEKIANHVSDKRLISKTYREFIQLNSKITKNQKENGERT